MAKTAKIKNNPTANPRSRASKRATSPSIDVDKSIKDAPRASDATPILSARPNSGVSKAKRKQKALTKGQRRRQEKGFARAEVVQDQLAKKLTDSSVRLKKRRERKGIWDEVNGTSTFDQLKDMPGDAPEDKEGDEWVDEDMEEVEVDKAGVSSFASGPKMVVADQFAAATMAAMEDENDEAFKIT